MKHYFLLCALAIALTPLAATNLEQPIKEIIHDLKNNAIADAQAKLQDLIEEMNPRERDVRILKERNEAAQKRAWHRVTTEKQNHEAPVISFVIPCYNRASVVRHTIESIYNQNLTVSFEVIAVDDASTDGSFSILQEYEKKYDNFFAYQNEANKKAPTTRNIGMCYARGTYICNADSDDILALNSIMPMLTAMMEKDYEIGCFQHMQQFHDNPNEKNLGVKSSVPNNEFDLHYMLKNDLFVASYANKIFTKKAWLNVGGYLEAPGHDAWSLSFRLHSHGYKGYIHPESKNYFRVWRNKSSMWWQDCINQVNDISPLKVTLESKELFLPESQERLINYHERDGSFITCSSRSLNLLPEKVTHALFKAYEYEDMGNFKAAYFAYERALQKGANSPIVYLKQARSAFKFLRIDLALSVLEKLSNIKYEGEINDKLN